MSNDGPTSTLRCELDEPAPHLEDFDLLTRGAAWVALSEKEALVLRLLLDRVGRVVPRGRLGAAGWPDDPGGGVQLTQLMGRLRRRIRPLGLEVATVRGRGYLLQVVAPPVRRLASVTPLRDTVEIASRRSVG